MNETIGWNLSAFTFTDLELQQSLYFTVYADFKVTSKISKKNRKSLITSAKCKVVHPNKKNFYIW